MIRRLITVLAIAVGTAFGALWWLHDGDIGEAVGTDLVEWDAITLARNAGVEEPVSTQPPSEPPTEPTEITEPDGQ